MSQRLAIPFVAAFLSLGQVLVGQCVLDWLPGNPQPHLSGNARCTTLWDPDGAGPLPQRLVVGGDRLLGGAQLLGGFVPSKQRVMTWDGSTWQALGGPGGGGLTTTGAAALAIYNGELIAGGDFVTSGGPDYIARWDGSAWQPLAQGFPAKVVALTTWNGNLVAAGTLFNGTVSSPVLHLWNGSTWTPLPTPPALEVAADMVSFEGDLIVGGSRQQGSTGVLERWNGTSWAPSILAQNFVTSLAVRTSLMFGGSDTLFVGGAFDTIGGTAAPRLARTNGAPSFAWSAAGSGLSSSVSEVHVRNTGLDDYVIVVRQSDAATPIMRYTSSNGIWAPMGVASPLSITYYAGSYHAVGFGIDEPACLRYGGSAWVPVLGPGIVGEVRAATPSGPDLVLGGNFPTISGVVMNGVARWDGSSFTPLGSGMVGVSVEALVTLDNGDIVAGGSFVSAGGTAANHIARWDGSSWSPLGSGMDLPVRALARLPNGDLVAGGEFTTAGGLSCSRIARWDGSAWSAMHFGMNDDVLALCVRSDGTLFAGGRFTIASLFSRYRVARWDGSVWGQVGAAMDAAVHGLAALPNGDIVAVGEFSQASLQAADRRALWNGSTWTPMGVAGGSPGPVRAVWAMPNGDVIAGRGFHLQGGADGGISRWNGTTWGAVSNLHGPDTVNPIDVHTIVQRADGDLIVGGRFNLAGSTPSHALAAMRSRCMPTATSYGVGCSSTAGQLVLTADTLPWLGATFRTTTSGVGPGSLCIGVIGFSQSALPLAALLPAGQPGCSLLAAVDLTQWLSAGPGTATCALVVPNSRSLIGAPFFQQTVPLEFDAAGALAAVRSSNALALVIGTL